MVSEPTKPYDGPPVLTGPGGDFVTAWPPPGPIPRSVLTDQAIRLVRKGIGVGEIAQASPADRAYVAAVIDALTDMDAAFGKAVGKLAAAGFAAWKDLADVGLDLAVDSLVHAIDAAKKAADADQAAKGADK